MLYTYCIKVVSLPSNILYISCSFCLGAELSVKAVHWATYFELLKEVILFGTPERRRPLGRPRLRWEDNIKIYTRELYGRVWTGFICIRVITGYGLL
jgi:hypothetical protein